MSSIWYNKLDNLNRKDFVGTAHGYNKYGTGLWAIGRTPSPKYSDVTTPSVAMGRCGLYSSQ